MSHKPLLLLCASVLMVGLGAGVGLGETNAAGPAAGFNGEPGGAKGIRATVTCFVANDSGASVPTVKVDNLDGSDTVYWLTETGTAAAGATTITFTVIPVNNSSDPIAKMTQVFKLASPTDIHTPFGFPTWAGNLTTGRYRLTVTDNVGDSAECKFKAVVAK